jgi:hypothetical protein
MHSYADRYTHDFFFERDYPEVRTAQRAIPLLWGLAWVESGTRDRCTRTAWNHPRREVPKLPSRSLVSPVQTLSEVPPTIAVTVPMREFGTFPVFTVNVTEVAPAGTVTVAGTAIRLLPEGPLTKLTCCPSGENAGFWIGYELRCRKLKRKFAKVRSFRGPTKWRTLLNCLVRRHAKIPGRGSAVDIAHL